VVYRNGAREGDLLCVTGDLGGAYAGLLVLEREKQVYRANDAMQPELEGYDYVLARQLKPEARTDMRNILKGIGVHPTAMIDISDGLASETLHICRQSKLGVRLYEEKIPIDNDTKLAASEFKMVPTVCALSGGEDYELLFTVRQEDHEKISAVGGITIIGHLTAASTGCYLVTTDAQLLELTAQGWDAMRERKE
jgi:thiamine-monophosphate kinase